MEFRIIDNKGTAEGYCLVKSVEKKINVKGVPYLDMTLTDRTGEIGAKLWDYHEDIHGWISPNMLVKVRGVITEFNGADQFRTERIRPVSDADGVRIEDFVPSAPYDGDEMFRAIGKVVDEFENAQLRTLVRTILDERKAKILYWPAAFKLHHAIRGGLLYHTLSILRLAQQVCAVYPFIDRELLLAGVILHDVAKTEEFDVAQTGIASGYTAQGTLIGHLVRGAMIVEKAGEALGTDPQLLMLLEHMLLSHHGEPEFGAAVRPMFLEAEVLSQLDLMDARINELQSAVSGVEAGEFSARQWALENRKFFNHGRTAGGTDAHLI
ncbi:MAG: HD domain-containing protein [Clostridia bacterium]|nr:HD domain-containing protein [Clostridia bacterium]